MSRIPMTIKGLMLDPISNAPIVVLQDADEKLFLPIWVGVFEANAIALQLENVTPPRPMTHDLLRSMIENMGGSVARVIINDLRESTFYAIIQLSTKEGPREIDARPSDAIALALRTGAPVFVEESVLEHAQKITPEDGGEEKLKDWLENATAEELGKYKM